MKTWMPDSKYLLSLGLEKVAETGYNGLKREAFSSVPIAYVRVHLYYLRNPFIKKDEVISFDVRSSGVERLDLGSKYKFEEFLLKHNKNPLP